MMEIEGNENTSCVINAFVVLQRDRHCTTSLKMIKSHQGKYDFLLTRFITLVFTFTIKYLNLEVFKLNH